MPLGQVLGVSTWPLDLAGHELVAALRGWFRGGRRRGRLVLGTWPKGPGRWSRDDAGFTERRNNLTCTGLRRQVLANAGSHRFVAVRAPAGVARLGGAVARGGMWAARRVSRAAGEHDGGAWAGERTSGGGRTGAAQGRGGRAAGADADVDRRGARGSAACATDCARRASGAARGRGGSAVSEPGTAARCVGSGRTRGAGSFHAADATGAVGDGPGARFTALRA